MTDAEYILNWYCNNHYPIPKDIMIESTPKEYGQKLLNRKRGKK